jgi:hypothetical protein
MDWAVYQELPDDVLITEGLKQPNRQLHVLLQGFAD